MKTSKVQEILNKLVAANSTTMPAIFLWGAPGIGKSAIVRAVAESHNISLTDVRLSQLSPTDLRGLPVVDKNKTAMKWVPPNFLPQDKESKGILFLDEFNMANGSMMGISQQLILDRRVGDYILPDGWIIIAAGNRSMDRASVNAMSAPVANRFLHYHVEPDLEDFKAVAYSTFTDISHETIGKILGFLNFKPELLHCFKTGDIQFPTPRSWRNAGRLIDLDLDPESSIGHTASLQYRAYLKVSPSLANLNKIMTGNGDPFSKKSEPSVVFATISALVALCKSHENYINSLSWLIKNDHSFTEDYIALFVTETFTKLKATDTTQIGTFVQMLLKDPLISNFVSKYHKLITSFNI